jgi:hypothetical protein
MHTQLYGYDVVHNAKFNIWKQSFYLSIEIINTVHCSDKMSLACIIVIINGKVQVKCPYQYVMHPLCVLRH